jgi:hypothetical protein
MPAQGAEDLAGDTASGDQQGRTVQGTGWADRPSQFLSARAEAERAFQLAERLGGVREGRNALVGWAVLLEG